MHKMIDRKVDMIPTCKDCIYHDDLPLSDKCLTAPIVRLRPIRGIVLYHVSCSERNKNFKCPFYKLKLSWWDRVKYYFTGK